MIPALMLVIGNTVGTGIFTTSGFIIKELGDKGSLLLLWLLGGIISIAGAISYGELGRIFPKAGGEYVFIKETFGEAYGFVAGWISLIVGFSAPIAATSIAFSEYLKEFLRLIEIDFNFKIVTNGGLFTNAVATLTIIALSILCVQRVKIGGIIQSIITLIKVFIIATFLTWGFIKLISTDVLIKITDLIPKKSALLSFSFPVGLVYVMYAYSGWNAAIYVGEEINQPKKVIPKALFIGAVSVMILYLALNTLYIKALSVEEMSGVLEIGAKTAEKLFGKGVASFLTMAIGLGLLSVLTAMILSGPRVYYAMARDGVFFSVFAKIDPDKKTPVLSVYLQAFVSIFMIVTSTFEQLLLYIGFTLSISSSFAVAGLIKITKKFYISAILFIASNIWITIFLLANKPFAILVGILTIISGFALYFFNQKKEGRIILWSRQK